VVRFACRTDIAAPVALAFDLSLSVDAHLDSMRGFGERAVAGVTSGQIGPQTASRGTDAEGIGIGHRLEAVHRVADPSR